MSTLYEPLPKEFVSQTISFDYKTPLTQALDEMKKFGAVIVTKDREYYGLADSRAVSRKGSQKSMKFSKTLPVGRFARRLPLLNRDMSIGKVIEYFHEFSTKAMPYGEGSKVSGVVKRDVVLRSIISLHLLSKSKVSDAMSMPVLTIETSANLSQAINAMTQNKVRKLVVLDRGKLFGIITHKDIYENFARVNERHPELTAEPRSLNNVSVKEVAKTTLYSVDYNTPMEDAIRRLLERGISSLVVTRSARPAGVLSIRDVFEVAAATMEKEKHTIIITGIDDSTIDYEQDIEIEAGKLIEKIDRFGKLGVNYAAINVNKVKNKGYELKARLGFERKGVIFATATGYGLESTLTSLLNNLFKQVKERKEEMVDDRRKSERYYGEEEE